MFTNLSSRSTSLVFSVLLFSIFSFASANERKNEVYLIKTGDTLMSIAREKYGDGGMWQVIYATNKDILKSGKDKLKTGWELKLPNLGDQQSTKKENPATTAINISNASNASNAGPEKQAKTLPPLPNSSAYKAAIRILFLGQLEGSLMPDHRGLGGILYMDAIAKKFKADNSLFLSVGDDIQGGLLANIFAGEAVIKSYSMLGIDAMNIGNHEFDYNSKKNRLSELFKIANKDRELTFLSANIQYKNKPFIPYKIYQQDSDLPIAVIGLIGKDATSKIHSQAIRRMKLEINDPIQQAKKTVKEIKKQQKNAIIIVLSDMSTAEEEALAKANIGIDFILGVSDKDNSKKEKNYGKTTLLHLEKENGRRLGVIDIFKTKTNDKNGKNGKSEKQDYSFYQVTTNAYETARLDIKTNQPLSTYIEKKDAELSAMLDINVANTEVNLTGNKYAVRTKETNLGNLIADSLLQAAEKSGHAVDAVFINSGSIQSDIPKGKITFRSIEKAMPYPNKAVVLELTGEDIAAVLEHSVSHYEAKEGRFLQVSQGFQYQFSCENKKNRISLIKIKKKDINPARIYRIIVNDFIATGGNEFDMLKSKKPFSPFNKLIQEIVIDYLKKEKNISPKTEERIVFDKTSCSASQCNKKDNNYLNEMKRKFEATKSSKMAERYKRMAWSSFLDNYSNDIKCTNRDNKMRTHAKQQQEKYINE